MELNTVGGKAARLLKLRKLGYIVPRFAVVTTDTNSQESINEILKDLEGEYFAVRSSANAEDGTNHSFAGMFDTFLYVKRTEVFDRVRQVFESAENERVLHYMNAQNIDSTLQMAVIIQEMVNASVSGVAFGEHPGNQEK